LIAALRWLPKGALSRALGHGAELRLPQPLQRWLILLFGRAVGVDFDEVRDPIDSFSCLQEFFTRSLVDGARPIDAAPGTLVSPCDGLWGEAGIVRDGQLLQIKGRSYTVAALLRDVPLAARFEGGVYATLYLAPCSYHRFHAPCAMNVESARYIPGTLWPVNRAGLEGVEDLFAVNERICTLASIAGASAALCLVAVGATLVGKVKVEFDDLATNRIGARGMHRTYEPPARFEKGQEWGRFEFGSTIVMLATPGALTLDAQSPGTPLRLGSRIGTVHQPADS
jgi:phosphatidylserine decarboxylase